MSQENPYRIFVTHAWEEDDDYLRVFEYLEEASQFYYRNVANPAASRPANADKEREALRAQIGHCEIVVALSSQYRSHGGTLEFEMLFAKSIKRPVILLPSFGATQVIARALMSLTDEVLDWDGRALVAAIKRHARGDGGPAWDVVEFVPD
jgi:hypothetical protein